MIDYPKMFSCFPVIDDQFDLVSVDCIRMEQDSEHFFVPIIRFMIRNHELKKVEAGLTLRTGAVCQELSEVVEFIGKITQSGMFLTDVSALGTVYDEDMNELEDVNWNELLELMRDDDPVYQTESQKPTYLH